MKSTFKRNMVLGFGLSLLLLVISSVASYVSIKTLLESSRLVEHTNDVIFEVENILSAAKDAETGQRGFLLTGKNQFLTPYNGAKERAMAGLGKVQNLVADNPSQQRRIERMKALLLVRLDKLAYLINQKKAGLPLPEEDLEAGRQKMDEIRVLTEEMKSAEQVLLVSRTQKLNKLAATTPVLILVASSLSIIITIIFFSRLSNDYKNRLALQIQLEEKDKDITRRINIIRDIADKVSSGNYKIRMADDGQDGLGNLSSSLNKMAGSLDHSFATLADKEWLQAGIAMLNTRMLGEKELTLLTNDIIDFVAEYTHSAVGAFYIAENNGTLKLAGSYALAANGQKQNIAIGEGLAGQCAASHKIVFLKNIPADNIIISHAAGEIKPTQVAAIPIIFENNVNGVIELCSLQEFKPNEIAFLEAISHSTGIIINTSKSRSKLQELLEETQSQSEELQAQHAELEHMNIELEIKTEKLQASEEELRVQQEELMQANQELEEKAVSLEEKNQLISEFNIDIQRKAEELALSTKYKSEFLANMSHELRTPLNSILLLSRLMAENLDSNLSPDQTEYASVIQSSGQGLLTLINEILDLSKIESGKMELEYEMVPVNNILHEAKSMFQPMANERKLTFEASLHKGMPNTVETDSTSLGQIIKNLLSNALKFTSKGFVKLDIVLCATKPGFFEIIVADSGIGISKEKQEMIFEAFQQADGSTRRKYGGTGLGLSITRELVRLLGGGISIESEPEKGSIFTVLLPIQKPDPAGQNEEISNTLPMPSSQNNLIEKQPEINRFRSGNIPQSIPDDREAISPGDRCIVIVEDDLNFARSLLDFTRKKGYKGIVAGRGDEGIELVDKYRPLGVLLDIQLPIKDGWQVMDEIKSNPKTRHIPVHIISSLEARAKSLSKGAINFVNKPVSADDMQEIFKKIEYIIEHNPKKVLIVEEDKKHAKALASFLGIYNVNAEITGSIHAGIAALQKEEVRCVILDMDVSAENAYDMLEDVKKTPGFEQLPIIVFTGKNLSKTEEMHIRKYADSIVVKTANSYQRILDEVSLFLHLMEEHTKPQADVQRRLGALNDVLQGKIVVVADDDVRNVFSLTKALENHKVKVLPAIDGKEALRQLEHNKVDAVLMDMVMPEMDGYETIKRIKANPQNRSLPVIAVTAKAMAGDREKCISAGASDYITKPVDIDQLISLLRVWLYETT